MTGDREITEKNTSLYYPFFQNMFDLADMTSSAWQPALKAIGLASRDSLRAVGFAVVASSITC